MENEFTFDGKIYKPIDIDDLTFAQYEIATDLITRYNEIVFRFLDNNDMSNGAAMAIFKQLSAEGIHIPLIALLFAPDGEGWTRKMYDTNCKAFENVKMTELEKARPTVLNFLKTGQDLVVKNSLISMPEEKAVSEEVSTPTGTETTDG